MTPAETIAYYMKRMYHQHLTTLSGGNLSIIDGDTIYVTPSEIDKGYLESKDIMQVDENGKIVGIHNVTSEFPVHQAIYQTNHSIQAILHAHTSSILGFSTARSLPDIALTIDSLTRFQERISIAAYQDPGSEALARTVAKSFEKREQVSLLENHGLFIASATMEDCFDLLEEMNLISRISSYASILSKQPLVLDSGLADSFRHSSTHCFPSNPSAVIEVGDAIKQQYLALLKRMYHRGLCTAKNACYSYRLRPDCYLVNAADSDIERMGIEDLVIIYQGANRTLKQPHTDFQFHYDAYQTNAETHALLSYRPPYAMAYAVREVPFDTEVVPECYGFLRHITCFDCTLPAQMKEALTAYFDDYHRVACFRHQLYLVGGPDLQSVYERAEILESTAEALITVLPAAQPMEMEPEAIYAIQKKCGIYRGD